jgi:hypothetical protein
MPVNFSGVVSEKEMTICKFFLIFLCIILLSGCSTSSDFHIENFAKTDIDEVYEIHMNQVVTLLRTLTVKLYKKNPYELQKVHGQTIRSRLNQIFICPVDKKYNELQFKESMDAISLGFEPEFEGDRIFAMMVGLYTMIHASYNQKCDLFMLDYLNAQNLYNSARNIEIFVWRLNTRKKENDRLFILTNNLDGEVKNLSYERIFGKLISLQDTLALIVSDRSGRIIKRIAQIAGMAFLPIGI